MSALYRSRVVSAVSLSLDEALAEVSAFPLDFEAARVALARGLGGDGGARVRRADVHLRTIHPDAHTFFVTPAQVVRLLLADFLRDEALTAQWVSFVGGDWQYGEDFAPGPDECPFVFCAVERGAEPFSQEQDGETFTWEDDHVLLRVWCSEALMPLVAGSECETASVFGGFGGYGSTQPVWVNALPPPALARSLQHLCSRPFTPAQGYNISDLAVAPDGGSVFVGCEETGRVTRHAVPSWEELAVFEGGAFVRIAADPRSGRVLLVFEEREAVLCDANTLAVVRRWPWSEWGGTWRFASDGTVLHFAQWEREGEEGSEVRRFDPESGAQLGGALAVCEGGLVGSSAVASGATAAVLGMDDGRVAFVRWGDDVRGFELRVRASGGRVAVTLSATARTLYACDHDGVLWAVDTQTQRAQRLAKVEPVVGVEDRPRNGVYGLWVSADETLLVVLQGARVLVLELARCEWVRRDTLAGAMPLFMSVNESAGTLAFSFRQRTIEVWNW